MTAKPHTAEPAASVLTATTEVRPEIQALRAIAVLGVLLFHLWPGRLPGGFVGVDVFFVVSGFLISDHLLRERLKHGRVAVADFWARRVRRLLPASLLVLLATTIAIWSFVPQGRWSQFGREIIASTLYVENWALAAQSVDYMALSNVKSPVQHFWTLSVEEQFYLAWPFLIVVGAIIASAIRRQAETCIAVVIVVATVASFTYSIILTATDPSVAYFSTLTRAWEFGFGALLAVVLRRFPRPLRPAGASVASWIGFAAIASAMVLYTGATPFPSYTAMLPVIGTILVIAAGSPRVVGAPTFLFLSPPVKFAGDVSYGTYLWHWPLLVLLPYALGAPLTTSTSFAVLIASFGLGWLSKRFVEDPIRTAALVSKTRPRWSFIGAAGAMFVVTAVALPMATFVLSPPVFVAPADQSACYGARSMSNADCGPAETVPLTAPLSSFSIDVPPEQTLACEPSVMSPDFKRCDLGRTSDDGVHVALLGDSHATRWVEPVREVVESEGGQLSTFLLSGCSVMSRGLTGSVWGFEQTYAESCQEKSLGMQDAIIADPAIDVVVMTNRTRLYVTGNEAFHPLTQAAVEDTIRRMQAAGKRVIVIKDPPERDQIPQKQGQSAADCLAAADDPAKCSLPRPASLFNDPMTTAAEATSSPVVDLGDLFCTKERCLSQIGGLVVYSDDNHMSRSFASSLVEALTQRLGPLL